MKHTFPIGMILVLLTSSTFCARDTGPGRIVLAENGRTAYRIVIAENASPSIKHGAEELQMFLAQMSGATLPIVTDREPLHDREIILGDNAHLRWSGVAFDISSLGLEGYHLKTVGSRLVIAGGPVRGALYGVYGLLEDHLGCRWFTPEVSHIPKLAKLEITPLDERKIPALEYREVFTFEYFDGDWSARNRVNSNGARLEAKHGGRMKFGGQGFLGEWFGHTFNKMVPREKYFASHPEYFSLVKGKRLYDEYGQLCCTNEDVIRLCTQAVLEAMRADPEGRVFSVSQNDTYPEAPNYCECENCQKLARAEESQTAPVLYLVNRVAEAVEKEFPDRLVDTFAYRWTQKPPKTMRPRKNVVIRLCTVHNCFSHSLASCDSQENRAFLSDLQAWSKTGGRLWIWDYVNDFQHYLLPFPNLRSRRPNIRTYIENGVKGIFEQDAFDAPNSEMAALGGYITAKYLWNPDYDETTAVREFLEAYYGPAAKPVLDYLNLFHDWVRDKALHVHMWERHPDPCPYIADDVLIAADRLWGEAEAKAATDAAVLKRVRLSRLSVDYAIVERARCEAAGKLPPHAGLKALALERFRPYVETLAANPRTQLSEGSPLDLEKYRRDLAAGLGITDSAAAAKKKTPLIVTFDVEDYITPESEHIDDIPKWLAETMTEEGVTGTFFVIGEKARSLENRGRRDVIAAMAKHEIGSHTNFGSIHPTVTEELEKAGWEGGVRQMLTQESAGFKDLERIFGVPITILARHGGSYGPQLVCALGRMKASYQGSPVSLPGHDVVWFANALNYSAQYSGFDDFYYRDDLFEPVFDKLKAELPKVLQTTEVLALFAGHPTKIRAEEFWDLNFYYGQNPGPAEWKTPRLRPQETMVTAQKNFRRMMKFLKSRDDVEITTYRDLMPRYAHQKESMTAEELGDMATSVLSTKTASPSENFSPAEAFAGLMKSIIAYERDGMLPKSVDTEHPLGPLEMPLAQPQLSSLTLKDVYKLARDAAEYIRAKGTLPASLSLGTSRLGTGSLYALFAVVYADLKSGKPRPEYGVAVFEPYPRTNEQEIIKQVESYKTWPVHRRDLDMGKIVEFTKLQLWTLKPAHRGS